MAPLPPCGWVPEGAPGAWLGGAGATGCRLAGAFARPTGQTCVQRVTHRWQTIRNRGLQIGALRGNCLPLSLVQRPRLHNVFNLHGLIPLRRVCGGVGSEPESLVKINGRCDVNGPPH